MTQQNSVVNHDEIAGLASQIWKKEGCQSGRDEEYWLQAEQLLLLKISQRVNGQTNEVPVKGKTFPATGKNSSRPTASAASSTSNPRKRFEVKP